MYSPSITMVSVGAGLVQVGTSASDPALAFVSFNDPERMNAMSEEMAKDFRDGVEMLKKLEPEAVVVSGAGRAFSAGGDMEMIRRKQQQTAEINRVEMLGFYRSFLGILDLRVPVVAAINGAAVGAGLCFACACDKRVVADVDENSLGFSFARLGLTPGMGGTIFPQRLVGDEKARDLLEKGYNITPRDAFEMGMVEMIVSPKSVMDYAIQLAQRLADKRDNVLSKRANYWELKTALEEEARLQGANFLTPEHRRLYGAFVGDLRGGKGL